MSFGSDFTDNPAAPGSESIATFLLGIPDGGTITGLNNIDYRRKIYAFYALDDFKMTPRLALNLGLRYEFFSIIKDANNNQATFDFNTDSLVVPSGQSKPLTPTLATELTVQRNGSRGLVSPDLNNFAPRIGFAYQLYNKHVLRGGYGIFYGGQENGSFSNPSPGFNPPFFASQVFSPNCSVPAANAAVLDCSISGTLPLNGLANGFLANSLSDPNTPSLYSLDPNLVTPYTEQWHLGLEYQLPADNVLEISYGGSRGAVRCLCKSGRCSIRPCARKRSCTAGRRCRLPWRQPGWSRKASLWYWIPGQRQRRLPGR